ncbi:MAG: magnesium transporter [Candidatus Woesearchaeota archaeon]
MTIYYNKEQVLEFIENKQWKKVKDALVDWKVQDIAELMNEIDEPQIVLVFRTLQRNKSTDVFSYLEPEYQETLLKAFTKQETQHILSGLDSDDRITLFEELPGVITRKLFKLLTPEDLKETRYLLGYPEESVGRLITSNYVTVYKDMTIEEALDRIRQKGTDTETLNRVYVIDKNKKLLDSIKLRQIVIAKRDKKIQDLMTYNPISLSAYDDQEKAVDILKKYDVLAIPVVDSEGIIIGAVTADDIIDIAEEEITEDIQKIASVEPLKTSYKNVSIFTLYKKRIIWLSLLVFVSLISSGVIAFFEETLNAAIALAFFIPLLIGSGGNIGSQSATLMIRALATEDVKMNEWFKVFIKEILMGLLIGITLGILALTIGIFRVGYEIGIIVGLSMMVIILFANIIGALLPFILSKLKIDPAVASSPLITTIVDAFGLIIYFIIAKLTLNII